MTMLEHGAFAFCGLLVYVLVTRIGEHRRQPSAAVAWVLVIAMLPYLGLPLFLLFGTRKFARWSGPVPATIPSPGPRVPDASAAADHRPRWATSLLSSFGMPAPTGNDGIELHADGRQSLASLLSLVRDARRSVAVCTFLVGRDEVGHAVIDELALAASRGLRVRLLLDAFGSLRSPRDRLRELTRAGGEVRWFMPLLHNPLRGRTNLRNHRKLAIADEHALWSGGRNLAAEYFVDRPGEPAWEDLTFAVQGPLAAQSLSLFEHDWQVAGGQVPRLPLPLAADKPVRSVLPTTATAQLISSGPDHVDDTVYSLLLSGAYHAQRRILAVTPYFVPDDALLSAWCLACRRGVEVTLLVPRRSNHPLADMARERSLRQLQQAGGRVLLDPRMTHAKAVVIDDRIALCGTVNLDARSLFLNFELMFAFYDRAQVVELAAWCEARCRRAAPRDAVAPGWWRDVAEGVVRAVGYQL
jgi:cardiolipin synthase A/B